MFITRSKKREVEHDLKQEYRDDSYGSCRYSLAIDCGGVYYKTTEVGSQIYQVSTTIVLIAESTCTRASVQILSRHTPRPGLRAYLHSQNSHPLFRLAIVASFFGSHNSWSGAAFRMSTAGRLGKTDAERMNNSTASAGRSHGCLGWFTSMDCRVAKEARRRRSHCTVDTT